MREKLKTKEIKTYVAPFVMCFVDAEIFDPRGEAFVQPQIVPPFR